jgi:restriction system protein
VSEHSDDKTILMGKDLTLERWLELMEKRPEDVVFESYQFPTNEIKEQFLANISKYSEKDITRILNAFLLPLGSFLGSDRHSLDHYARLLREEPEELKRLIQKVPYYRRMYLYVSSQGKIPVRDGISWVMDLLPFSPREALDALDAYLHAHIYALPDGRIHGLSDAMAILRTRYFSTDDKLSTSVLNSLKPIELEHLVEAIYYKLGYVTQMTKPSHDGGRDIIAMKDEPGKKEKNLIQCKRWQNAVGVEDVRALLGVVSHERATKGTLVTTSRFSPDAKKMAKEEPRIELIARKPLQRLLTEHFGEFWVTNTDFLLSESLRRHPLDKRA